MPILHFSGRFKFQLAYFNNYPKNDARNKGAYDKQLNDEKLKVEFDPILSQDQVHERLLCDPTKYFEFEFSNVKVTRITYDDGSNTDEKENNNKEPIIGKSVLLKGMLVDLAPHLQRGQLYAGEIRITDTLTGRVSKATQSSVQKSIRIIGNDKRKNMLFHYSAYFETELYEVFKLIDPYISEENSRFIKELNDLNLKIYFTPCKYDIITNEGEVYGYIGPALKLMTDEGLLIRNRKLLINDSILTLEKNKDIINDFEIETGNESTYPRATFEIYDHKSLLILRYQQIMPFLDYKNNIPNYQCYISLSSKKESNSNETILIDCSYEEIKKDGGIKVIKLSDVQTLEKLNPKIKVRKSNSLSLSDLLIEPIWNIMLDKEDCIKIYSNESIFIEGFIYNQNKLHLSKQILELEAENNNPSSPFVAWFEKEEIESDQGKFGVKIIARNLENSGQVYDPITEDEIERDLPWDRYYGNGLTIKFKDVREQSTDVQLMVRVIHSFDKSKNPTFNDIEKIFSYYMRYYPWLHVRIEDCNYSQFFDFNNKEHLIRLNDSMKTRLTKLDDHDWYKMPRSRDFPQNGYDAIEKFLNNIKNK
jgi:hypothetical protein